MVSGNGAEQVPGPPSPPRCDYCEKGRPAGVGPSYRDGCVKHDPKARAALEEDIYETALVELAHLDDDERVPAADSRDSERLVTGLRNTGNPPRTEPLSPT